MNPGWWDILAAALSGGAVVKILDHLYNEYRRRTESSKSARDVVNKNLDPILKAADELVGKIRSLAQSDFREILSTSKGKGAGIEDVMPLLEVVFLCAQFWARIQILRMESVYINLSSNKTGKQLLEFLRALEAQKTRLVDRAWQRGMGEALIEYNDNNLRCINYFEFSNKYLSVPEYTAWFRPIILLLEDLGNTKTRQRLLAYGIILHALIDTLDAEHLVTRNRPGWPNKLSTKNKKAIHYRVFPIYLNFVKTPEIYYGKVKRDKEQSGF